MAPSTDDLEPPKLRDLADRARRIASTLRADDDRSRLLSFAVELEGQAADLERESTP